MLLTIILLAQQLFLSTLYQSYPTVLIHGITSNTKELLPLQNYLTNELNIDTYNIEIGNGVIDSISMNMNNQCDNFANSIAKLNITANKINIIGISQGGLNARCYVERYSYLSDYPDVNVLMTIGTPHAGFYNPLITIKKLEYWKDPLNYDKYLNTNDYLVDLNNERVNINSSNTQKGIAKLAKFIMIWSNIDKVIKPLESAKFEFYDINIANKTGELIIQPFEKSEQYKNNLIGLKTLQEKKDLLIWQIDCEHDKFKTPECFIPILNKFIKFF